MYISYYFQVARGRATTTTGPRWLQGLSAWMIRLAMGGREKIWTKTRINTSLLILSCVPWLIIISRSHGGGATTSTWWLQGFFVWIRWEWKEREESVKGRHRESDISSFNPLVLFLWLKTLYLGPGTPNYALPLETLPFPSPSTTKDHDCQISIIRQNTNAATWSHRQSRRRTGLSEEAALEAGLWPGQSSVLSL